MAARKADTVALHNNHGDDVIDGGDGADTLDASALTTDVTLNLSAGDHSDGANGTLTSGLPPAPAGMHYVRVFAPDDPGAISSSGIYPNGAIDFTQGTWHYVGVQDGDTVLNDSQNNDADQVFAEDLDGLPTTGNGIGAPGLSNYMDANGNSFSVGWLTSATIAGPTGVPGLSYLYVTDVGGDDPQGTGTWNGSTNFNGSVMYSSFTAPEEATVTFSQMERIELGSGDDLVIGSSGADNVFAGGGDDTLLGGAGNDSLSGGADADTFTYSHGGVVDTIVGGEGGVDRDTLQLNDAAFGGLGATIIYSSGEGGSFIFNSGSGTFSEIEVVVGGESGDAFLGGSATTGIEAYAAGGFDFLQRGSGNDLLYGGTGGDSMLGGAGADQLHGDDGNDTLRGGDGNDTLLGGDGVDRLYGDAGDDLIIATGGNDTLIGGIENDSVEGGAGDDVIFSGSQQGTAGLTPVYSEQTGTSDSFTGTNGNSDFSATTTTDGVDLATGSVGTLNGHWVGSGGDDGEVHSHIFSQEIAGAQIRFNAVNSGKTLYFVIDGQTINLNDAIVDGDVTFDWRCPHRVVQFKC